jgi:hypothetical protein
MGTPQIEGFRAAYVRWDAASAAERLNWNVTHSLGEGLQWDSCRDVIQDLDFVRNLLKSGGTFKQIPEDRVWKINFDTEMVWGRLYDRRGLLYLPDGQNKK